MISQLSPKQNRKEILHRVLKGGMMYFTFEHDKEFTNPLEFFFFKEMLYLNLFQTNLNQNMIMPK